MPDKTWFDRQTSIDNVIVSLISKTTESNQILTQIGNGLINVAERLGSQVQSMTPKVSSEDITVGSIIIDSRTNISYRLREIRSYSEYYSIPPLTPAFTEIINGIVPVDICILSVFIIPLSENYDLVNKVDLNHYGKRSYFRGFLNSNINDPFVLNGISQLCSVWHQKNEVNLFDMPLIFQANKDRAIFTKENLHPTLTMTGIECYMFGILDKIQ